MPRMKIMNENSKSKLKAIGHLSLNVNENNEGEEQVPTSRFVMDPDLTLLYIAGWAGAAPTSQGVEIVILKEIEADTTYPFESGSAVGSYNPKNFSGSSWSSVSQSGEVTVEEIDLLKRTAKGSFKFTARSRDHEHFAEIHGDFHLQQ